VGYGDCMRIVSSTSAAVSFLCVYSSDMLTTNVCGSSSDILTTNASNKHTYEGQRLIYSKKTVQAARVSKETRSDAYNSSSNCFHLPLPPSPTLTHATALLILKVRGGL
jgi:hypothetical protein